MFQQARLFACATGAVAHGLSAFLGFSFGQKGPNFFLFF
ncbi:unnamed protein product [Arabidopsis halleri]